MREVYAAPPPSMPGSPGPPPSGRRKVDRAEAREMSKQVAGVLSDLSDELYAENLNDEVIVKVLVATAPVVMEYAMKGNLK